MKKALFILTFGVLYNSSIAQSYSVSTAAGNGSLGWVDSTSSDCELYWPYGLASDNDSLVFFSDGGNHRIRKFNYITNVVTTIAGNGTADLQDGIGSAAHFNWPDALYYKNGYLYVSYNKNDCIRKIDLSNNMVTTIAGTGVPGFSDGPVATAMMQNPGGLVVDSLDDIYFADGYNYCIRKISGGIMSTIAGVPGVAGYKDGPADSALFHRPRYITLDSNGVMFITDINNNVIRKYTGGVVSTFAGTGVAGGADGAYNTATFSAPVGIASTFNNYLYVIDGGGNKLRKIDSYGNVTTIAGDGNFGFNDGPGATAEFYYPQGVCYDEYGYIYMADRDNNRIRKIDLPLTEAKKQQVTGIKKNENTIGIYPNPTSGILNVKTQEATSVFQVYNVVGENVKSGTINSLSSQVDLRNLPDGIYTIVVSQNQKKLVSKISLQK
jgi:hypothetical protein